MSNTMRETILQKARELAGLLAASDEFAALREQETAAQANAPLQQLYSAYHEKRAQLEEATMGGNPDYDAMGRLTDDIDELQAQMRAMEGMKALEEARGNFTRLMNGVNAELQKVLAPEDAQGGCGGDCAGCHGCH